MMQCHKILFIILLEARASTLNGLQNNSFFLAGKAHQWEASTINYYLKTFQYDEYFTYKYIAVPSYLFSDIQDKIYSDWARGKQKCNFYVDRLSDFEYLQWLHGWESSGWQW